MGSLPPTTNGLKSPKAIHRKGEKPSDLNIRSVVLGDVVFKTWYPSYYPETIVGSVVDRLYVCQWCFKYSKDVGPYLAHIRQCVCKDMVPPGRLIYEQEFHTIYELDGEEHRLFAQNLSLFAKLFLDNKSIFFDVTSFNYYLLSYTPKHHNAVSLPQVVGFFSKEKMSWDNNNLACILVFPPWQRKGFGKILMGVSYELSRREKRIGGPEKPLSELGRIGYMQFWTARVTKAILEIRSKSSLSVGGVAERCAMSPEDVMATLKDTGIAGGKKRSDGALLVSKAKVREYVSRNGIDLTPPIDEDGFLEVFAPEELEDGIQN
ncbi:SAS complex subunit [Lecanora helva]